MNKSMLIDAQHQEETRVVIVDDGQVEDFDHVTSAKAQVKGNIYLAKITRVEPSLQAAFVEYGGNKQGFLPFSEIHPDYYQIPVEDRKRLIEEDLAEAAREEEDEEAELENKQQPREGRDGRDGRGGGRRGKYGRRRRGGRGGEQSGEGSEGGEAGEGDERQDEGEEGAQYQAAEAAEYAVSGEFESSGGEPDNHDRNERNDRDADSGESELETVSADDGDEPHQRRRGPSFKRYRIQEVIKRNQIVLVQVIKEERGNKGCSLTTYISLAGRYCVLMPNSPKGGGVSRKIGNGEQRRKLKEVVAELKEKRGLSAIIRTAGLDRTKTEIKRDYEYLIKVWNQIREDTMASNAPALIYEESDIIKRTIRDVYTNDIDQILVQGEHAYKDAKNFMKQIMPSHAARIKQYKEPQPIFAAYGVESQLASMYEPTAKLASGGYIVLQPTEALISIDVNSGRSTTERNVEETAIKTNMEAAYEIARQLRLRDLAGLIVIDFIDMYYGKNRRMLEKAMKDALKLDRAKIQISRISAFGLMELSRQRLRPSIAESSTVVCPHCHGVGHVRSVETVAIQIIRVLEREAVSGEFTRIRIASTSDVLLHLMNDRRHMIQDIESKYGITIEMQLGSDLMSGEFRIVKISEDGKETIHREVDDSSQRRKGRRGRRGGKGRNPSDERRFESGAEGEEGNESSEQEEDDNEDMDAQNGDESSPRAAEDNASGAPREDRPRRRSRSRRRRSQGERGERRPDQAETVSAESTDAPAPRELSHEPSPHASADAAPTADVDAVVPARPAARSRRRAPTSRGAAKSAVAGESDGDAPSSLRPTRSARTADASGGDAEKVVTKAEPAVAESGEAEGKEKRKGWWNRVLEG